VSRYSFPNENAAVATAVLTWAALLWTTWHLRLPGHLLGIAP
jgi:hypothetical protein